MTGTVTVDRRQRRRWRAEAAQPPGLGPGPPGLAGRGRYLIGRPLYAGRPLYIGEPCVRCVRIAGQALMMYVPTIMMFSVRLQRCRHGDCTADEHAAYYRLFWPIRVCSSASLSTRGLQAGHIPRPAASARGLGGRCRRSGVPYKDMLSPPQPPSVIRRVCWSSADAQRSLPAAE